ncbi:hypothetical protein JMK10_00025 [Rhodovulum sulfidophilum]|uniref:hypothetical protein n=1 Tax=Rhodovulum sulfidophilum TaxID=35806 RepID=UPI0019234074|nr:hypothetical protein [Rhodovulum sulfidophilum]MBL3576401.1 hypothetical protein [Rhodovulum sulfidophilum]MCE8433887.1 hypothetical protein [Rhodovulum sulfidophilum]MCF4115252.1 hypothetical protein [Rhodovulum sulfidophilum]
MTIANFGMIFPLQMGMLMLSGYRLTRENGATEMLRCDEDSGALLAMHEGRRILENVTEHDFGYSLRDWYSFIINEKKHSGHYIRASTWVGVERAVKAELRNPGRGRLEALADQM